ncbi:MAG: AAA family ATPase [Lachnospiraceae bacterium]|nr:AAA family ATPase [Lachnospiraceae bacterium]
MNIKQAKEELLSTIQAYLVKDETGEYAIPTERQRPILLMGPPGIGKTAIMEQVAEEAHINLVSYTITHHTRQSAIGLPFIRQREYGGKTYSVTEYTMSEIIASVYEQMERSGIGEGILFLDEINCVSETLAPTMLQFLQYKTFGTHRVPEGWVIVTAGNPPQYNKSVRDFDIVTLDRVRKIDIDVDFDAFREYAYKAGIHGAVLGYLQIRKEHFYRIRNEAEDRYFVTARGWEDLSRILKVYEKIGHPVNKDLVQQYLEDPEVAEGFATYYELWNKYRTVYRIPDILNGTALTDEAMKSTSESLSEAPFDEKLSILSLLIDSLGGEFREREEEHDVQKALFGILGKVKKEISKTCSEAQDACTGADEESTADGTESDGSVTLLSILLKSLAEQEDDFRKNRDAKLLSREDERIGHFTIEALKELVKKITLDGEQNSGDAGFDAVKQWFSGREKDRIGKVRETNAHLTNAFEYIAQTFGEGQEMVLFLSELSGNYYSLRFVNENGNEAYFKYNKVLLLKDREDSLRQEILQL